MATASSARRQAEASSKAAKEDAAEPADQAREAGRKARRGASEAEDSLARSAEELASTVSDKLKTYGVDTDVMVGQAKEHASELQRLIGEELRARPFRALGIAAAVGLLIGLISR